MRPGFPSRIICVLALGVGCIHLLSSKVASAAAPEVTPAASEEIELDKVRSASKQFESEFNAGNTQGIVPLFTENAELVDADENVVKGQKNIGLRFASLFEESPGAKIQVEISSLRLLSSDVAVEDGISSTSIDGQRIGGNSPYTVVYLKQGGKWLIARVRDYPEQPSESAHDRLQPLAWLVGEWVDESEEGRVETSTQWSEDGNYLVQHYTVTNRRGKELTGTQRLAWDPVRKTIRSWIFDNSGGFGEATWTQLDDKWLVKVEGITSSGEAGSAIRIVTQVSPDIHEITSTSRLLGNQVFPDTVVRIVRRPPAPMK